MSFLAVKSIMGSLGVGYIILNIIRVLNILSILSCILASGSPLVKTAFLTQDKDHKLAMFNLFDLAEKVMIILFAVFLLLTELPKVLQGYFARNWPKFSHQSGFTMFSVCMLFLGCDVLSYLTKEKTNEKSLGCDFYRMCQAAGFMALVMGMINLVATLLLKDKRRGLTARQVRAFKKDFAEGV